jgi:prevent-host-death family protein
MNLINTKSDACWQLQDAKARFSNVVKRAEAGVPQLVTRNGVPTVYIVDAKSFEQLEEQKISRKNVLLNSPLKNVVLDLKRECDNGREIVI